MANDRHRRTGTRSLALLVSLIAATACTGAAGNGSTTSISASPTVAPAPRTLHDGPLGVFGALNGVRALTPVGLGKALFRCRTCTETTAADWSPDGTHLAFSNEDGLSVVDIAEWTDRVVVVKPGIGDIAWSPDGSRIAYVDDGSRIILVNPDGSGRTAIVGGSDIADLAWSPDGSRIAYSSSGRGLNIAGVYSRSKLGSVGWGQHPVWSPDGSTLAFFEIGGCAIRQLSSKERGGDTVFDLTSVAHRCEDGVDLAWSPDGTELAALVSRDITSRKGVAAVYLVKPDGSRARAYTDWLASGWEAWRGITWQPVP
jgi:Tol biopolymer transport system component